MKKLLVLMLVLGMASWASATPIITAGQSTINGVTGETVTLTLSGTYAEASGGTAGDSLNPNGGFTSGVFIDIDSQPAYAYYKAPIGLWTGATIGNASAATIAMGVNKVLDGAYYSGISFVAAPGSEWGEATDVDTGTWFTFDVTLPSSYSGAVDGSVTMEIDVGWKADLGGIGLTVVPEPMTIALLGLGGLFLRRRK